MLKTLAPTRPRASAPSWWFARLSMLAELVTTPLAPADYVDLIDPLRSRSQLRARIVAVLPETPDAATIVLRPGKAWRPHLPGQYVRLGVDVDGVRHWRAYSLTSRPDRTDGCITVTVKAIPDGVVSNHLVRRTLPGDIVQLDQAAGEYTLPDVTPATILFVVAGSGVTPAMGMLRSRLDELHDVVVVHCAMSVDDAIFLDEFRSMHAEGRIRLVEQFTDRDGLLDTHRLHDLVPDALQRETWACGPAGLLDALETHWQDNACSQRLHIERFGTAFVEPGAGGTATFAASGHRVDLDGATTLLDAGEADGVLMPSGCRMGICFRCVVPLSSGAVRDLRTGEVTQAEPGDDLSVQTCINTVATACELDI